MRMLWPICFYNATRFQSGKKKVCFIFHPHPRIHRKRATLSTLNLLSNSFSLENHGFEEWGWYVICLVYYKSEFSQYFCFVLFISWELCNQSRCLKQSRKRPLWIRENLVHSIFFVCVYEEGGHDNKANILFSVCCGSKLHLFKDNITAAPVLVKTTRTFWLHSNDSSDERHHAQQCGWRNGSTVNAMQHMSIMENKTWRLVCFGQISRCLTSPENRSKQRRDEGKGKRANTKERERHKDKKRNIIYPFNECACPKASVFNHLSVWHNLLRDCICLRDFHFLSTQEHLKQSIPVYPVAHS